LDWTIELNPSARKQFAKLDRTAQLRIRSYLNSLISDLEHPTERGKPLVGKLAGTWRYRTGDYRMLCEIQSNRLIVLVIRIGHRSTVYD
jgi:mRNA interferase RelE/StbE